MAISRRSFRDRSGPHPTHWNGISGHPSSTIGRSPMRSLVVQLGCTGSFSWKSLRRAQRG